MLHKISNGIWFNTRYSPNNTSTHPIYLCVNNVLVRESYSRCYVFHEHYRSYSVVAPKFQAHTHTTITKPKFMKRQKIMPPCHVPYETIIIFHDFLFFSSLGRFLSVQFPSCMPHFFSLSLHILVSFGYCLAVFPFFFLLSRGN